MAENERKTTEAMAAPLDQTYRSAGAEQPDSEVQNNVADQKAENGLSKADADKDLSKAKADQELPKAGADKEPSTVKDGTALDKAKESPEGKEKADKPGFVKKSWKEVAEMRKEQLQEITDRLEAGVKEYMTNDVQFKKVLETMAKFHHYSANNVLLIAMQMPTATRVGSYTMWKEKFHRQVKRGQKGLSIIAPAPYKKKTEREVTDPATGRPVLDRAGNPQMEEVEITVPRYKVVKTFDISQTFGEPLPELDVPELIGSLENYKLFMDAIRSVSPVPIRFDEIESGAKGYFDNAQKEIVIRDGMSETQTMKTAVHELSHSRYHDRDKMRADGNIKSQQQKELEAESIAFTVLSYYKLADTSDYSIPYLASWSGSQDTNVLRASMDTIRRAASEIIDEIDDFMAERIKERDMANEQDPERGQETEHSQEDDHGQETEHSQKTDHGQETEYSHETDHGQDTIHIQEVHRGQELDQDSAQKSDYFTIYQIRHGSSAEAYSFMSLDFVKDNNYVIRPEDFQEIYRDKLTPDTTLEGIYSRFNMDERPSDYQGHSLSVSDIVVLHKNGEDYAYYVDSIGFTEVPEFLILEQTQSVDNYLSENQQIQAPPVQDDPVRDYSSEQPKTPDQIIQPQHSSTAQEKTTPNQTAQESSAPSQPARDHLSEDIQHSDQSRQNNRYEIDEKLHENEEKKEHSDPVLTYCVAECMDFPVMGAYYEGLTLAQAAEIYRNMPESTMSGGKGIICTIDNDENRATSIQLVTSGHVQETIPEAIREPREAAALQAVIIEARGMFPNISNSVTAVHAEEQAHTTTQEPTSRRDSVLAALRKHQKTIKEKEQTDRGEKSRSLQIKKGEPTL